MPKISEPKLNRKQQREAKRKPKEVVRETIYPEVQVQLCHGETALTVEKAKELLGWENETEEVKFAADYQLTDASGAKVRTRNNTRNRPFDRGWALSLSQEILRKRWRLNGETIVIDKTGEMISGQHRCAALVFAEQIRVANEDKWIEEHPQPVTLSTVLVLGVEDDDDTVNTADTGKPRTLTDVLYRSHHFAKFPSQERKKIARVADYAIRLLWLRTGAKQDAYAPIRNHSESVAFLDNHKTLMRCIEYIYTEDKEGAISKYISPGTAAGLCYLMATAKSDGEKYRQAAKESGIRQEKGLDFSLLDKAEEFWMLLGAVGSDNLKVLRNTIKNFADPETGSGGATMAEKIALIILAWNAFVEDKKITVSDLKLQYREQEDEDDPRVLTGTYEVGGIDVADSADEEEETDTESPLTEKEVEQAKKQAKEDKKKAMASASPPTNKPKSLRDEYAKLCDEYPDRIIFLQSRDSGNYTTIDGDAIICAKELELEVQTNKQGVKFLAINKKDANEAFDKLVNAGNKIAVAVEKVSGMKQKKVEVKDWTIE